MARFCLAKPQLDEGQQEYVTRSDESFRFVVEIWAQSIILDFSKSKPGNCNLESVVFFDSG